MLFDILVCGLAAAGIILLLWCLIGFFLLPLEGTGLVTVFRASGDGQDLERQVRGHAFLKNAGVIGASLVIVDYGLDSAGVEAAGALAQEYDFVDYLTKQEFTAYFELE